MNIDFLSGDVREVLKTLPSNHFDCIVSSPPYWSLRSYLPDDHIDKPKEIGMEPTMQGYIDTMVDICNELKRVLKPEGTFWLNIGDTYATNRGGGAPPPETISNGARGTPEGYSPSRDSKAHGLGNKNLCMIPNRIAIALQDAGWIVRSEIIWHKPNSIPESVKDRPTRSHEKVWFLTKKDRYFYDADAIREPVSDHMLNQIKQGYDGNDTKNYSNGGAQSASSTKKRIIENARKKLESGNTNIGANARNVWTIKTKGFSGAHFATMPLELAEKCIKAGCPVGGRVLDPFGGAGTTGLAANNLGRNATLIELNDEYINIAKNRISPNLLEHFKEE